MTEKLLSIPGDFWYVLSEIAPYLLLGFFVAGLLAILIRPETVERHLGGKGSGIDAEQMKKSIEDLGYTVTEAS